MSRPSSPAAGTPDPDDRTEQYFANRPTAPSRPSSVPLVLSDLNMTLQTDRGVFSADRVDPGTKLLLMELPPEVDWPAGPVVDVGCGYGPVACVLAARSASRQVWAVDVNERARELCERNANVAKVAVRVIDPAGVPMDLRPALVVSNPPIRIGKRALHALITEWLDRLTDDGEMWLVVHKHLGADSLADWIRESGWQVMRVRSRQGYRILRVLRP